MEGGEEWKRGEEVLQAKLHDPLQADQMALHLHHNDDVEDKQVYFQFPSCRTDTIEALQELLKSKCYFMNVFFIYRCHVWRIWTLPPPPPTWAINSTALEFYSLSHPENVWMSFHKTTRTAPGGGKVCTEWAHCPTSLGFRPSDTRVHPCCEGNILWVSTLTNSCIVRWLVAILKVLWEA